MRRKIKLVNICIRHKCTYLNNIENSLKETSAKTPKKLLRIKCHAKADDKPNIITSTLVSYENVNSNKIIQPKNTYRYFINCNYNYYDNNDNASSNLDKVDVKKNCKILKCQEIKNKKHNGKSSTEVLHLKSITCDEDDIQCYSQKKPVSYRPEYNSNNNINNISKQANNTDININQKINKTHNNTEIDQTNNKNVIKTIESNNKDLRLNELNMQMLSKKLHDQVFVNSEKQISVTEDQIKLLKNELEAFGMKTGGTVTMPDVNIDLPPLEGKNLEEHFEIIAKNQAKPYLEIINNILNGIPEKPNKWILQEGWTRYTKEKIEKVDYPLEDGLIFDVEVCMKEGPLPTLATAVSSVAWYGWVSKALVNEISIPIESRSFTPSMLIPLESSSSDLGKKLNDVVKKPKIIVGHNVAYDRARIKEQYWLNATGARFVDTMSLHVSISGMNSYQRALMLTKKDPLDHEDWTQFTSLNNLADVYQLYCNKHHEKSTRDVFVEGSLIDVKNQFNELMDYCASDVKVTHEIFQKLFPLFQERFPHPVTFAGMLELGTAYLPVNTNWTRYIEESESIFEDLNDEAKISLSKRADEVCKLLHDDKYKKDLWMWDQDWSTQKIKMKSKLTKKMRDQIQEKIIAEQLAKKKLSDTEKYLTDDEDELDPLEKEFSYLHDTVHLLPAKPPHMPGYPAWYRKLCMKDNDENWAPGSQNISTSMKVVPKLLNLTWENYPLHHIREHGWGFLVPYNDDLTIETSLPLEQLLEQCPLPKKYHMNPDIMDTMNNLRNDVQKELTKTEFWRNKKDKTVRNSNKSDFYEGSGIWCNVNIDNCCWFIKLPHKDGPKLNVGNPLAKDYLNKFSENVLAGLDSSATEVLKIAKMMSYWRNNRDRILSQLVVWLDGNSLPSSARRREDHKRYGAIIPQVVVSGTLTRRATEPTWMTASNAHVERVGSELRAMVQAPPGFNIVGADVDSQELWIASIIGDAYCAGIHGATPFGWMTLIGNKSNSTDMHSITAKAVGISRDHAKVINYARIYGAGVKFAERLLKQFNPSMSESEASSKSRKMFSITKGKKIYRLKQEFVSDDLRDVDYTASECYRISRVYGKSIPEIFQTGKWRGGSESAMFNRLEEIAESRHPVTPFLNSRLSRALEVDKEHKDKYLPTKINWVVQSGAVDFLHLMLVSMKWLMKDNARFCLSFHDEIRYIVPSRYKYNATLAMHVTNLLTRSFCALRLGINDLPMSVAFFASVEVDTVLRKEATLDCKTPSNPYGLENGYGVAPGESLNIWKAIEKSGGLIGPWHNALIKKKRLEKGVVVKEAMVND